MTEQIKWRQDIDDWFLDSDHVFDDLTQTEVDAIKESVLAVFETYAFTIGSLGNAFVDKLLDLMHLYLNAPIVAKEMYYYRVAGQSENKLYDLTMKLLLHGVNEQISKIDNLN